MERGFVYICEEKQSIGIVLRSSQSGSETYLYRISDIVSNCRGGTRAMAAVLKDEPEGKPVVLLDYQQELAEDGYNGRNTVICAPTGSGKTVVAASIVRRHLATVIGRESASPRKACFFVTNASFLEQQGECFKKYLSHRWKVATLCGSTTFPVLPTISNSDVVVITPQLIVNLIRSSSSASGDCDRFAIEDFSMLVFDEAHHTNTKHPYNEIMASYHEKKHNGGLQHGKKLPQVIGLTASLGIGDAKNVKDAMGYMLKICANLDSEKISRVRKHKASLKALSDSTDEVIFVKPTYTASKLFSDITKLISSFEGHFLSILCRRYEEVLNTKFTQSTPPPDKESQVYMSWFMNLMTQVVPRLHLEQSQLIVVKESLDYIEVLYRTLELLAHFPCETARKSLDEGIRRLFGNSTVAAQKLINDFQRHTSTSEGDVSNELFLKLFEVLVDEFCKNSESRAIVYLRTRQFAALLRDAINEDSLFRSLQVRADVIVGVNAAKTEGGSSLMEMTEALKKFKNGDVRVLCATSVADEGIDIKECNLIIKYNYATNEIAHVQRRGRGRAVGSRCLLLTNDEALRKREERNIFSEKVMDEALDLIDALSLSSESWFRTEVMKRVDLIYEDLKKAKALEGERVRMLAGRKYNLLCRKCRVKMCTSDEIVTDKNKAQYFCINPNIWQLCIFSGPPPIAVDNALLAETFNCAFEKCGHLWGRFLIQDKVVLPAISAKAFVLQPVSDGDHLQGELVPVKQWKTVVERFFLPRKLTTVDLLTMKVAMERRWPTRSVDE